MLKPLGNKIIIELLKPKLTNTNIILVQNSQKRSQIGKIIAIGEGKISDNNQLLPLNLKIGDKILFSEYAGNEIEYEGKSYLILKEDEILAIID